MREFRINRILGKCKYKVAHVILNSNKENYMYKRFFIEKANGSVENIFKMI